MQAMVGETASKRTHKRNRRSYDVSHRLNRERSDATPPLTWCAKSSTIYILFHSLRMITEVKDGAR